MKHEFKRVRYGSLNSRQREAFNFQKVSAVLADYGFVTIRLTSDWQGADFIAQHKDGSTFLKLQLKGRLAFYKKYQGRGLYVCFPDHGQWFVYPHDELLNQVLATSTVAATRSLKTRGGYSFRRLSKKLRKLLEPYRIEA